MEWQFDEKLGRYVSKHEDENGHAVSVSGFDVNMNNPLEDGLVGMGTRTGGPRGYRYTTDTYQCVWSSMLDAEAIEQLADGVSPWDVDPEDIIEYKRLKPNTKG